MERRFHVLLMKLYVNLQKGGSLYTGDVMKTEFQVQNYRAWTMV